jgi:hypothetical protein
LARGVRTNATLLPTFSPSLQPQSVASYDAKTRRNTILIAEIVPTIQLGDTVDSQAYPADRYYANLGALTSVANSPFWLTVVNGTLQAWDSGAGRYVRLTGGGEFTATGQTKFIYPTGPWGPSATFDPKNTSVTKVRIHFKARFNANADYATFGVGAGDIAGTAFSTATDHFIQVLRNSANWELGSCDGATISQSASAGGADGSFHEFRVEWVAGGLTLFVDNVSVITKSTNLPARSLATAAYNTGATNTIDVKNYLVDWE